MIEQAASVISEDNTELACAFIQKTAVEKALPEMDKRLTTVQFFLTSSKCVCCGFKLFLILINLSPPSNVV